MAGGFPDYSGILVWGGGGEDYARRVFSSELFLFLGGISRSVGVTINKNLYPEKFTPSGADSHHHYHWFALLLVYAGAGGGADYSVLCFVLFSFFITPPPRPPARTILTKPTISLSDARTGAARLVTLELGGCGLVTFYVGYWSSVFSLDGQPNLFLFLIVTISDIDMMSGKVM